MRLSGFFKFVGAFLSQSIHCRKLGCLSPNQGIILTYHRILPGDMVTPCIEPGMYVTPNTLKIHLRFLKKYFCIVSNSQFEMILREAQNRGIGKPYCVLSFDDGWRDFYTYAWPVLRDEGVPAINFLPTGLIGSDKMFWTDRLARIIEKSGEETIIGNLEEEDNGKWAFVFKAVSFQQKIDRAIKLLKQYPYQKIEEFLRVCEDKSGISCSDDDRAFMNWNEVKELFAFGLISFGSHTVNHAILTRLPYNEVQMELQSSREKLIEEQVVSGGIPFCYPNGDSNHEIARLVEKNGYSFAVSCDSGWNESATNMFSLKRISLHQDISYTASLLASRLVRVRSEMNDLPVTVTRLS